MDVLYFQEYLLAIQLALEQIPAETIAGIFATESNWDLVKECTWIQLSKAERDCLGVTHMELKGRQLLDLAEQTSTAEELSY